MKTSTLIIAAAISVASSLSPALAAGKHAGGHGDGAAFSFGKPGQASDVTRTVTVTLHDNYYKPESITVKAGETVRFVLKNAGEFVHEFSIATEQEHRAHQPMMTMMMEHGVIGPDKINYDMMKGGHGMDHSMAHDDPNSVLLEPGKSGEVIWTFAAAENVQFACNVPGHYDSGMVGPLKITD